MKKSILYLFTLVIIVSVHAQEKNYKVVFDMSSKDTVNQQAVTREIGLIKGASPEAKL